MLDKLRDIAIRFQIDPESTVGHAAKLESVVKVLSKLNESFNNFLEIEFLKNDNFRKAFEVNPQIFKTVQDELDLYIVDLKFSSFEAAIAPNIFDNQISLYKNEVLDWKKETYLEYKETIIMGDFDDVSYIKKISKKYSDIERQKIFQPLFSTLGNGKSYSINIKDNTGRVVKAFHQPEKEKLQFLLPRVEKIPTKESYGTYQIYAKVRKSDGKIDLKKTDISKFLYYEELEYETYPYKPNLIKFDGRIYSLNEKIECDVEFQEGIYIITNEYLDITVWGETREQAEDAFNFSFHSMYINYATESNDLLSNEAIELKNKINNLVNAIFDEAKKN